MNAQIKDHTLIIAEKPRAAAKIAMALGLNEKHRDYGIPYWVGRVRGKLIVVVGAAGHLFTLSGNEGSYPVFNYRWVPRWVEDRNAKFLTNYFKLLNKLSRDASEYINACDYDIEGSVIGYMIISNFGDPKKSKRMKFSSLTMDELRQAFNDLKPIDWDMIEAGLCRHELDWLWGINVSRALSDVFGRIYKRRLVLSAGRVQSPTLVEVVRNFLDISTFVPDVKFSLSVKVVIDGSKYLLENLFDPFDDLGLVRSLSERIKKNKQLKVNESEVRDVYIHPPSPFNLPDLQYEASRIYGYSPSKTLSIAEELYLDSLISYPRTNSQKLPRNLNNREIISNLAKIREYSLLSNELLAKDRLIPSEGEKDDPAHPAIYPTGYKPSKGLRNDAAKVYDLIVRRYLASFADSIHLRRVKNIIVFDTYRFSLSGSKVISNGWSRYYPYIRFASKEVPLLKAGDFIDVADVKVLTTYSRPPQGYTKTSMLKWMESVGIGTEATRAEIIENLFRREYLKTSSKYVEVTELGFQVVKVLSNFFSDLTSVDLTRKFEELLNNIIKGTTTRIFVISEAKQLLKNKLDVFKERINKENNEEVLKIIGSNNRVKCQICERSSYEVVDGIHLCEYHLIAYKNLKQLYGVWKRKLGIDWNEYLKKLSKIKYLGKFSKDVIDYLLTINNSNY
ncbi:MAG: DNA topoisomerase I [Sulfolobales archaeon]